MVAMARLGEAAGGSSTSNTVMHWLGSLEIGGCEEEHDMRKSTGLVVALTAAVDARDGRVGTGWILGINRLMFNL